HLPLLHPCSDAIVTTEDVNGSRAWPWSRGLARPHCHYRAVGRGRHGTPEPGEGGLVARRQRRFFYPRPIRPSEDVDTPVAWRGLGTRLRSADEGESAIRRQSDGAADDGVLADLLG